MKFIYTKKFQENFSEIPPNIQNKFAKQANFLLNNLRHPSLHAKKYDEERNVWQARIDRNYRFWFMVEKDRYTLLSIAKHPK